MARHQKPLAITPREFPLSANSHPAVGRFDGAKDSECRPSSAKSCGEKAGGLFPVPTTRPREFRPMRFVRRRRDPSSTADRLVPGDLLRFESLKRGRNIVLLSDVVRCMGDFLEKLLSAYRVNSTGTNISACRHAGRRGWPHRACSVVPKRSGDYPPREHQT